MEKRQALAGWPGGSRRARESTVLFHPLPRSFNVLFRSWIPSETLKGEKGGGVKKKNETTTNARVKETAKREPSERAMETSEK